tara:strand:- start:1093 stop:1656 length:564 start_codon:yes stop_codon:yes gene_type:complete
MFKRLLLIAVLLTIPNIAFTQSDPIVTENYNESTVDSTSDSTTTVISPPPSAISPSINSSNSDLCTIGVAGAVQTQILGISAGSTVRDMNCEKLKNAITLYNMGMKVAAVSVMCQDERVFEAMANAGTPCPIDGKIGDEAKQAWDDPENEYRRPDTQQSGVMNLDQDTKTTLIGGGIVLVLLAVLLL